MIYKEHKKIWITPFFRGRGQFYKKDYELTEK